MENKGTEEKITYPNIFFTVDNFEDVRLMRMFFNDEGICFVDFL
jgi:hypothetical protein